MPDYEYTDIDLKEFQLALEAYLDRWVQEQKGKGFSWFKDWDKLADDAYSEIMYAVTTQGLSPAATGGLSEFAGGIYDIVLKTRASYEWQKQYKGDLDKWAKDVVAAKGKYSSDLLAYSKLVSDEAWKNYYAQVAEQERETKRWQQRKETQSEMWENWRAQQNVQAERWGAQGARWAAMANQMGGMDRGELARVWSSAMGEAMSVLDPVRDWAKLSDLKQKRNPYAPPEENVNQMWADYEMQRAEADRWDRMAKDVMNRAKDTSDPLFINFDDPNAMTSPEQWRAHEILRSAKIAKDKLFEIEGELAETATYAWGAPLSEGQEKAGGGVSYGEDVVRNRPWHPETPTWLSNMYPEATEAQLWGTRGGEKPTISPPSPQAWRGLSPDEQSRWAGYVEYQGQDPGKLLTQMGQMLPQPRRGTTWKPARQRVSV